MNDLPREVVYLTGDRAEKRRVMRESPNVARALNDEVSVICRVGGKDYYVQGKHPFADFSVWQYLRYERALISPEPLSKRGAKLLLRRVGVNVPTGAKLGRLDVLTRRLVTLAARVTNDTATLAIDLDGAPYSLRLRRKLRSAVNRLSHRYGMWISVTDSRLVPGGARRAELRPHVIYTRALPVLRSAVVSRRRLCAEFAARGALPAPVEKGTIVSVYRK